MGVVTLLPSPLSRVQYSSTLCLCLPSLLCHVQYGGIAPLCVCVYPLYYVMYSMVVAATARPLPFEDPLSTPLVEGSGHTTSASYRKSSRVTRWTGEGQLTHVSIVSFTIL